MIFCFLSLHLWILDLRTLFPDIFGQGAFWDFASNKWESEEIDIGSMTHQQLHRLAGEAASSFVSEHSS